MLIKRDAPNRIAGASRREDPVEKPPIGRRQGGELEPVMQAGRFARGVGVPDWQKGVMTMK